MTEPQQREIEPVALDEIRQFLLAPYSGPVNGIHKRHLHKWAASLTALQARVEELERERDLAWRARHDWFKATGTANRRRYEAESQLAEARRAVEVKPLVWKPIGDAEKASVYGVRFIARCSFGEYFVNSGAYGKEGWSFSRLGYAEIAASSADEAKAAAQADFETRIRSALAPPATPPLDGVGKEQP